MFALLALIPLVLAYPVNQSTNASPDGTIVLENVCGTLSVVAWDKPLLQVTGELEQDSDELRVTGGLSRVQVKVRNKSQGRTRCATLHVQVPAGARLEVETVSANLDVAGVRGSLDLDTVSGDVKLQGEPKEAAIETVSGDVRVDAATRSLEVETVSGDIEVHKVSDHVEARTVSGQISVEGGPFGRVDISTVSGDLSLSGALDPQARVELGTHSGNVTLHLPKGLSATCSFSTFSGDIVRPAAAKQASEAGTVTFTEGTGTATLSVVTHSGSIELKGGREP